METIIRSYLEKCIESDLYLKERYEENRISNCLSYIQKQAKEFLQNKNGWIEDSTVYKWAVDYFLDVNEKEKEEERLRKAEQIKNTSENIISFTHPKPKTIYDDEESLFFGMGD